MVLPMVFAFGLLMALAFIPVVVVELAVVRFATRRPLRVAFESVLLGNLASVALGVLGGGAVEALARALGYRAYDAWGDNEDWVIVLYYVVAFVCSVGVEAFVYRAWFARRARQSSRIAPLPGREAALVAGVANVVSYGGLLLWLVIWNS
jgi:hypothetical protein